MVYIPSHLYHIVFELLKVTLCCFCFCLVFNFFLKQNSFRATIERYGLDAQEYPAVQVCVVKGHEDLTIQIADRGGKCMGRFLLDGKNINIRYEKDFFSMQTDQLVVYLRYFIGKDEEKAT